MTYGPNPHGRRGVGAIVGAIGALALLPVGGVAATGTGDHSAANIASSEAEHKPILLSVSARRMSGFDRLVLTFNKRPPAPRVPRVGQLTDDPSGEPIALEGGATVKIAFNPATAYPWPAEPHWSGRPVTPRLPLVRQVKRAGDFEGLLILGVGLTKPARVTVSRLASPARILIDFRPA